MTMEEGTIVDWPLEVGSRVEKGRLVLVIESEKNEVEIAASAEGFLRHVYVEAGETVPCGTLLGVITETMEEPFDVDAFQAAHDHPDARGGVALEVKVASAEAAKSAAGVRAGKPIAPAARAAARKSGIDPSDVPGTGPGGRVTKQDVEAYARARRALVPVAEGISLEIPTAGEGDPVVLIPGLGTDASAFTRQIPELAEHFRVLAVNLRGVGLSDAPEVDVYTVAQLAADVGASYEGRADLIGASLGAAVALELALTQPGRVRSLTLITPFVEASARLLAVCEGWRRVAMEATPETLAATLLPWFFSSDFLADERVRSRTLRGLAQMMSRVPATTLDRMIAGMSAWSGTRAGDLRTIPVPTLVIVAGADLLVPDGRSIAASIPDAESLMVDGAGHAVALEAADAVNEGIARHLDRRS